MSGNAFMMISTVEKITNILKALGDPNRLRIVMAIGKGSCSVTDIINDTGLSQTLVSFHLKALRNAVIAKTERRGPFIYYSLSDPGLMDILHDLSFIVDFLELRTRGEIRIQPPAKDGKAKAVMDR